jgi:hypothetical protein
MRDTLLVTVERNKSLEASLLYLIYIMLVFFSPTKITKSSMAQTILLCHRLYQLPIIFPFSLSI